MKKLPVLILVSSVFFGCQSKLAQPIVDYSTNYKENERMLLSLYLSKKQSEQTMVLVNNKESNMEHLRKLMAENKIKNLNIIKDSSEITKLSYSYKKTKTVIIVNKK
ncbi:hypothetical protein CEY12_10990 [Chryseobacterium sp. T16E-39]|uniref:hypothetical protein n=1 Tax=Chryseobacterium sp. T16E-39 TaxID=2015076 RepID=UPI000B5B2315|nr:hypothetical protein [Chryseobacterium sp. T16E-39]ASK30604.1 hypothetical protein CEY12_10990 [Chryseobacterium sp. T16E-39]